MPLAEPFISIPAAPAGTTGAQWVSGLSQIFAIGMVALGVSALCALIVYLWKRQPAAADTTAAAAAIAFTQVGDRIIARIEAAEKKLHEGHRDINDQLRDVVNTEIGMLSTLNDIRPRAESIQASVAILIERTPHK